MMSLELIQELAADLDVSLEYSTKKYYKQYPFRLQFKQFDLAKDGAWGRSYIHDVRYGGLGYDDFTREIQEQRNLAWEQYKSIRRALFARSKGVGYAVRHSIWHGLNVYTLNEHDVRMMLNNNAAEIKTLYMPMNEAHSELHDERSKEVRRNLFYKKYRYKLEYNGTAKFKESVEGAAGCMPDDDTVKFSKNTRQCLNEKDFYVRQWNICSIYFEYESDWLTFKMMCSETPLKVVEAVLFSEVDK